MSHIHQLLKQAYLMLLAMLVPCESKHLLRRQGKADDHIHSFRSYHNYWPIIQRFVRAYAAAFPSSKSIKYGRSYVPVWLQQQAQRRLAITTLKTYRSALNKLYGIHIPETGIITFCPTGTGRTSPEAVATSPLTGIFR